MDSFHASVATGEIQNSVDVNLSVCTPTPVFQICLTQQGTNIIGSACLSTNIIPSINAQVCTSMPLPQQSIENFRIMNDYNFR